MIRFICILLEVILLGGIAQAQRVAPHVRRASEGQELWPDPGYTWKHLNKAGRPTDLKVEWRSKLLYTRFGSLKWPNVVSSEMEGFWNATPGYTWVRKDEDGKPEPGDFEVRWNPGESFESLDEHLRPHIRAATKEGFWKLDAGYVWTDEHNELNRRWFQYLLEIQEGNEAQNWSQPPSDAWIRADRFGRWWDGEHDLAVAWKPGLPHDRPGVANRPNVVASESSGLWIPAPGYTWSRKDSEGKPIHGSPAEWTPGTVYHSFGSSQWPLIVAGEKEGAWLPQPNLHAVQPGGAQPDTLQLVTNITGRDAMAGNAPETANPVLVDAVVELARIEGNVCVIVSRSDAKLDALQSALESKGLTADKIACANETGYENKYGVATATVGCILLNPGDQGPRYGLPLLQYDGRVLFETLDSEGWPVGVSKELITRFADWRNCYVDSTGEAVRMISGFNTVKLVQDAEAARAAAVAAVLKNAREQGHLTVIVENDNVEIEAIRRQLIVQGIDQTRISTADNRECHDPRRIESGLAACVLLNPGKEGPTHVLPLSGRYANVTVLDCGLPRPNWFIFRIQKCVGNS